MDSSSEAPVMDRPDTTMDTAPANGAAGGGLFGSEKINNELKPPAPPIPDVKNEISQEKLDQIKNLADLAKEPLVGPLTPEQEREKNDLARITPEQAIALGDSNMQELGGLLDQTDAVLASTESLGEAIDMQELDNLMKSSTEALQIANGAVESANNAAKAAEAANKETQNVLTKVKNALLRRKGYDAPIPADEMTRNYGIDAKLAEKPLDSDPTTASVMRTDVEVRAGDRKVDGIDTNRGVMSQDRMQSFNIYDNPPVAETPPAPAPVEPVALAPDQNPQDKPEDKPEKKGGPFGWLKRNGNKIAAPTIGAATTVATLTGAPQEVKPPVIERPLVGPDLGTTPMPDIAATPTVSGAPVEPGVALGPEAPVASTVTDPNTGREINLGDIKVPEAGAGGGGLEDLTPEQRQLRLQKWAKSDPAGAQKAFDDWKSIYLEKP